MDQAQVKAWLQAGQAIGAHTRTHPRLTHLSPLRRGRNQWVQKISRGCFWSTHPAFLLSVWDWNQAVRDLVAEAGYQKPPARR
jgi:peptidoglycan/xylan/chitin deacetylase (PgdA/CDA1 family)